MTERSQSHLDPDRAGVAEGAAVAEFKVEQCCAAICWQLAAPFNAHHTWPQLDLTSQVPAPFTSTPLA